MYCFDWCRCCCPYRKNQQKKCHDFTAATYTHTARSWGLMRRARWLAHNTTSPPKNRFVKYTGLKMVMLALFSSSFFLQLDFLQTLLFLVVFRADRLSKSDWSHGASINSCLLSGVPFSELHQSPRKTNSIGWCDRTTFSAYKTHFGGGSTFLSINSKWLLHLRE